MKRQTLPVSLFQDAPESSRKVESPATKTGSGGHSGHTSEDSQRNQETKREKREEWKKGEYKQKKVFKINSKGMAYMADRTPSPVRQTSGKTLFDDEDIKTEEKSMERFAEVIRRGGGGDPHSGNPQAWKTSLEYSQRESWQQEGCCICCKEGPGEFRCSRD